LAKRVLVIVMILWGMLSPAQGASARRAKTARKKPTIAGGKHRVSKHRVSKHRGKRQAGRRSARVARKPPAPVSTYVPGRPSLEPLACDSRQPARDHKATCLNCSEQSLAVAHGFLGLPYRSGGASPETGFDCSGFVQHVFHSSCRLQLPRTVQEQFVIGTETRKDELQRGDLVFFRRGRANWHVGIYTGNGQFIHSPNQRQTIQVSSLDSPYYKRYYIGARRLTRDILPQLAQQALPAPRELAYQIGGDR
jgi:murein DD-endopeptidase